MKKYLFFVVTMMLVASMSGVALAQPPQPDIPGGEVFAEGFNGPQGILVGPDGNVWVIDSGTGGDTDIQILDPQTGETMATTMGNTARIVMITPDGQQTDVATLPSVALGPNETSGGARLTLLNGTLYATVGAWVGGADIAPPDLAATVVKVEDGNVTEVVDLWDFENANNPDGHILESHPYGIVDGPDGWLWVADAGANDLLRIDPASGEIELVAVFQGLPRETPNPARGDVAEADPVPTGITFGADGNFYVSLLSGAPFTPGSAKVIQVTPGGEVSDYATQLTTLTDIRRGPDGAYYAVKFADFTQDGPQPNTGAILRIQEGDASEVLLADLPFPTSLAFDSAGNAYVTVNGVGAPGSGAVVRLPMLTELAGEPAASMQ